MKKKEITIIKTNWFMKLFFNLYYKIILTSYLPRCMPEDKEKNVFIAKVNKTLQYSKNSESSITLFRKYNRFYLLN